MTTKIKSTDPRKKLILRLLKTRAGNYCSKVTNVAEEDYGNFSGDCYRYSSSSGKYELIGRFCVQLPNPVFLRPEDLPAVRGRITVHGSNGIGKTLYQPGLAILDDVSEGHLG